MKTPPGWQPGEVEAPGLTYPPITVSQGGVGLAPRAPFSLVVGNGRMARLTAAVLVSSVGDPLSLTVTLVLLYGATRSPLSIAGAYLAQMAGMIAVGALVGGAADRLDRRKLVVRLEIVRSLVVASLLVLTSVSVFFLFPALFVLGGIEALVQPSRQAAVPEIVDRSEVGAANSLLLTALSLAQALGFAIAAIALTRMQDARPLFLADAVTFAISAALVSSLGNIGGGVTASRIQGGIRRAWHVPGVPPLLVVAGATVFCIGMLNPALLPVAYTLSSNGPSAYAVLQIGLISGLVLGSVAAGWVQPRLRYLALAVSLWTFAAGVGAVAIGGSLTPTTLAVCLSGIGNAVFSVTNSSALMDAATRFNRGTVMAARYTVNQVGKAIGLGAGAAVGMWIGPRLSFAVIAAVLAVVAGIQSGYAATRS